MYRQLLTVRNFTSFRKIVIIAFNRVINIKLKMLWFYLKLLG